MLEGANALVHDMGVLLSGVKEASEGVNEGCSTLFNIISESSNVGEEIAKSVQEIAQGATNQAAQLEEGVRIVGGLVKKKLINHFQALKKCLKLQMKLSLLHKKV